MCVCLCAEFQLCMEPIVARRESLAATTGDPTKMWFALLISQKYLQMLLADEQSKVLLVGPPVPVWKLLSGNWGQNGFAEVLKITWSGFQGNH